MPYVSDDKEQEYKEEAGMEHEISTSLQHQSEDIEIRNNGKTKESINSMAVDKDIDVKHETLLDTIKCELVSIAQIWF